MLSKLQRRYSVPSRLKARTADLVVVDIESLLQLLHLIRPDRAFHPEAQSWGLIFRLLQHADHVSLFESEEACAHVSRAIMVSFHALKVVSTKPILLIAGLHVCTAVDSHRRSR